MTSIPSLWAKWPRGAHDPRSLSLIPELPEVSGPTGTGGGLPSHKAGHWVLGHQAAEPRAADAVVQWTLAACNDSTDLTNVPPPARGRPCQRLLPH